MIIAEAVGTPPGGNGARYDHAIGSLRKGRNNAALLLS